MKRGSLSIETGGAATFASLTGTPADNAALAVALAAKTDRAGDTMTGGLVIEAHGASGSPALHLSGTAFTGGTGTTTKPLMLVEPAGTTSHAWNASGTMLGVNMPSAFTGDAAAFHKAGVKQLSVTKDGKLSWGYQGSFDRKPVLFVDGPFAQVEWVQGGDGNVSTQAPLVVGYYLNVVNPADGRGARLQREADNHLGIRQSYYMGSPLEMRLYGLFTDDSNYERLSFITTAGAYSIRPEASGTGALRDLHISGLPTSNPGPGILWNNGGTPAIGT